MESNSILNGLNTVDTADYSESHLAWYTYNPITDTNSSMYGDGNTLTGITPPSNIFYPSGVSQTLNAYDAGGSALSAIFTLATWSGAETESAAPFTADTLSDEQQMINTMKSNGESLRYNSYAHLQNADCLDNSSRDTIKKAIMNQGALNVSLYYDSVGFETGTNSGKSYYQTKLTGKKAIQAANHCVTLIGWDDSYSKNNFNAGSRPSSNGAWLIANSYGSDYNDNGYFWVSYEEPSLSDIYTMAAESTANYENIYQYDGNGWSNGTAFPSSDITGANVFTSGSSFEETLNAVSFYTMTDNQKYTVKIAMGRLTPLHTKQKEPNTGFNTQRIFLPVSDSLCICLSFFGRPVPGLLRTDYPGLQLLQKNFFTQSAGNFFYQPQYTEKNRTAYTSDHCTIDTDPPQFICRFLIKEPVEFHFRKTLQNIFRLCPGERLFVTQHFPEK